MNFSSRKKPFRAGVSILLVFFMMLSLITPNPVQAAPSPTTAKLSDIKGEVYVKKAGGQTEYKAFDGMVIAQGDWIRTGESSSAKIVYNNGAETVIAANSQVTVTTLTADGESTKSSIKLWAGNVWNKVKRLLNIGEDYKVETPTAVLGVRGTLYLVSIDPVTGETRVDVIDGAVAGRENTERTGSGQEYVVIMGEHAAFDPSADAPPVSQAIDIQELVETVEPRILAKIMTDLTERVSELVEQAKTAQTVFEQTQDVGQIQSALALARQSSVLAEFAQTFVEQVQESPKAASVDQLLQESNTNLEQIQTQVTTVEQQARQTESEIREKASEVLTEEQIEEILETAPSSIIPSETLTPPPATPGEGGAGGGSGDDGGSLPPPQNSAIAPTEIGFDKNELPWAIGVEINYNGNSLAGIQYKGEYLQAGTDYFDHGSWIELSGEFLSGLEAGEHILIFVFSAGNPAQLTLTVAESVSTTVRIKNIELASVSSGIGQEVMQGNGDSWSPSLSRDGSRVVFDSWANTLVSESVDGFNVYVRDRVTKTTALVNTVYQGDYYSSDPRISADGRYVVFTTDASLVPDDEDDDYDIYLKNLDDDSLICITTDDKYDYYGNYSISGDGRYVAFECTKVYYGEGDYDYDYVTRVYVFDREKGTIIPLELDVDNYSFSPLEDIIGEEEFYHSSINNIAMSGDGRFIVFSSFLGAYVGETSGVFVHDLTNGETTFVGLGIFPDISADGRFITYQVWENYRSFYEDLFEEYSQEEDDEFRQVVLVDRDPDGNKIYDEKNAAIEIVSRNANELANGDCELPQVDAKGEYIVYSSFATNLVAEEVEEGVENIYLWSRKTGKTYLLSKSLSGELANGNCYAPVISDDATTVAFNSYATNLVPNDQNGYTDVFVLELDLNAPAVAPVFPTVAELKATAIGSDWAKLEWGPPAEGADRYEILRATAVDGEYQGLAYVASWNRVYWDTSRQPGLDYYYKVVAENEFGRTELSPPVLVESPDEPTTAAQAVPLAAGSNHSLAISQTGKLLAWGGNESGQLGIGSLDDSNVPVEVSSSEMADIISVDAGERYSVALSQDGTVWTWGENYFGQLGTGSNDYSDHPEPVQVPGLTDIVGIAAGERHVLALQSDGTVWAWGTNTGGALGNGTEENRYSPQRVKAPDGTGYLTDVVAVSAGAYYSLALKKDGTVWAWGSNSVGQLGIDEREPYKALLPKQVKMRSGEPLSGVVSISAGREHALALTADGTVYAWGYNGNGQVGNNEGNTELLYGIGQPAAVPVLSAAEGDVLSGIQAIAAGYNYSLAVDEFNRVLGWGDIDQFGFDNTSVPTVITALADEELDIEFLATGSNSTIQGAFILILDSNGVVRALGCNYMGQLGIGYSSNFEPDLQAVMTLKQ